MIITAICTVVFLAGLLLVFYGDLPDQELESVCVSHSLRIKPKPAISRTPGTNAKRIKWKSRVYRNYHLSPEVKDPCLGVRNVPKTIASVNVMRALARAYDIPLPPSGEKCAIYQALSSHPLWGTQPKRRFLRIPEADDAPLTHHELAYCPHISERIAALLQCTSESADVELLYSEDQMAYAKGGPTGVGIGRLHTTYDAYLDRSASAIPARPLNERACRLLHSTNMRGPVLVTKTTFIKSHATYAQRADILCFERVDEHELGSGQFKQLREEWIRYGSRVDPTVGRKQMYNL
ncbi:hypothetical protein GGX14DRAFT_609004 [Mycena pura]|uniref:Uncharacterized protein n=1 Tax=Mycena pura TaxID=153505 RepID=A0AAD6XZ80_9AGAR|nr:hypothetical protein GGX14DRAFT_609004 [Mycena pura]